jgi:hypothetical protein
MRALVLGLLLVAPAALAAEVAGVQVPDRIDLAGTPLVLNGAGIRTRIVFKVYVGALYLAEKKTDAAGVLAAKGAKRVSMALLRDLRAEQLVDALDEGIRANHGDAEVAALKPRMDALAGIMRAIGAAPEKTLVTLDYVPGSGTRVTVNGAPRGESIPGEDFYAALLKIWLGDKPADGSLKKAMLGQGG